MPIAGAIFIVVACVLMVFGLTLALADSSDAEREEAMRQYVHRELTTFARTNRLVPPAPPNRHVREGSV